MEVVSQINNHLLKRYDTKNRSKLLVFTAASER